MLGSNFLHGNITGFLSKVQVQDSQIKIYFLSISTYLYLKYVPCNIQDIVILEQYLLFI